MALDATGTPTTPDSIPKYNTAVDPPSGKGFNAAMDQIQVALNSRVDEPSGIASGEVPVWNGSAWVRSSVTGISRASLATTTRILQPTQVLFSAVSATADFNFQPTGTTRSNADFFFPEDYVSGDLTVKVILRPVATSGNTAVFSRNCFRFRSGVAYATIESGVAWNQVGGFTIDVAMVRSYTITVAGNLQAGDLFRVDHSRLGDDAGDTYASALGHDGVWVEYTGRV